MNNFTQMGTNLSTQNSGSAAENEGVGSKCREKKIYILRRVPKRWRSLAHFRYERSETYRKRQDTYRKRRQGPRNDHQTLGPRGQHFFSCWIWGLRNFGVFLYGDCSVNNVLWMALVLPSDWGLIRMNWAGRLETANKNGNRWGHGQIVRSAWKKTKIQVRSK